MSQQQPKTETKLIIPAPVLEKIRFWVDLCNEEDSGFGEVEIVDGNVVVLDAFLIMQTRRASSTRIDALALAKAVGDRDGRPGVLRWWWHSHASMPVFFSGTDDATLEMLAAPWEWYAATVFNKRGEMYSCMRVGRKAELQVFCNVPTVVGSYATAEVQAEWRAEFERTAIKPPPIEEWKPQRRRDFDDTRIDKLASLEASAAEVQAELKERRLVTAEEVRRNGAGFRGAARSAKPEEKARGQDEKEGRWSWARLFGED